MNEHKKELPLIVKFGFLFGRHIMDRAGDGSPVLFEVEQRPSPVLLLFYSQL